MDQGKPQYEPQDPKARLRLLLNEAERLKEVLGKNLFDPEEERQLAEQLAGEYLGESGYTPEVVRSVRPEGLSFEEIGLLAKRHLSQRVIDILTGEIAQADASLKRKGLEESDRADVIFETVVTFVRRHPQFKKVEERSDYFNTILREKRHDFFERDKREKIKITEYGMSVEGNRNSAIASDSAGIEAQEARQQICDTIMSSALSLRAKVSYLLKHAMGWPSKEVARALDMNYKAVDTMNTRTGGHFKQLLSSPKFNDLRHDLSEPSGQFAEVMARSDQLKDTKERAALQMYAYFGISVEAIEKLLGVEAKRTFCLWTEDIRLIGNRPAKTGKEGFNG